VVCLSVHQTPRLILTLEDRHLAKDEAKCVVGYMRNVLGLKVAMITGDNTHAALRVANYLDIPEQFVTAKAYPHQKKQKV